MRRAYSVILGILLGALAAGVSIGVFLKLANDDRAKLAEQLSSTIETAKASRQENLLAIQEANNKLTQASLEVTKAQQLIATLQQERTLLASATPLTTPNPRSTRDWKDAVAIPLGVSIKYPSDSTVLQNSAQELTLAKASASEDARWFSMFPYSDRLEAELRNAFTSSTPVSYIVQGHLLTGLKGTLVGQKGTVYVLRVQSNGVTSHLLWLRDLTAAGTALNVLASLQFKT